MRRSDNLILKEIIIALLCAISLSSCASGGFGQPDGEPMDWTFIQSVGGIRLGDPYLRGGRYWVPVLVDVSGAQTITVTPTLRNTGLVCTSVTFSGSGSYIDFDLDFWLTVYTEAESPSNGGRLSSECNDIPLNFMSSFGDRTYNFYYIPKSANSNIFRSKENLVGVIN